MAGWLAGLAVMTALFVAVPHLVHGLDETPPWMPWVRIGLGMLLIVAAIGRWLTRTRTIRPPAFLDRLAKITPAGAGIIGFGLVVANRARHDCRGGSDHRDRRRRRNGVARRRVLHSACRLDGDGTDTRLRRRGKRVDDQLERVRKWMRHEHAAATAVIL